MFDIPTENDIKDVILNRDVVDKGQKPILVHADVSASEADGMA
jgi:ATP-dependent protease Clp ATPase subunit